MGPAVLPGMHAKHSKPFLRDACSFMFPAALFLWRRHWTHLEVDQQRNCSLDNYKILFGYAGRWITTFAGKWIMELEICVKVKWTRLRQADSFSTMESLDLMEYMCVVYVWDSAGHKIRRGQRRITRGKKIYSREVWGRTPKTCSQKKGDAWGQG